MRGCVLSSARGVDCAEGSEEAYAVAVTTERVEDERVGVQGLSCGGQFDVPPAGAVSVDALGEEPYEEADTVFGSLGEGHATGYVRSDPTD